nr:EcsC family protein [Salibacterium salarium]
MNNYEQAVREDVDVWLRKMKKPATMPQNLTKNVQTRINKFIPQKFQQALGQAVKQW